MLRSTISQLEEWNKYYREGKPVVPDSVYDALLNTVPEDHPYRTKVEPEELYKGHIRHSKPLLSMQKAKTDEEMNKWFRDAENSAGRLGISLKDAWININQKLDGIAGVLENDVFATRGNGIEGNDVSSVIKKGIKLKINMEYDEDFQAYFTMANRSIGEFVVDLHYFNKHLSIDVLKDGFSNARNFVSGAVMSETLNSSTEKAYKEGAVIFQAYSNLPSYSYSLLEIRDNFREAEKALWDDKKYLIDGVILSVINKDIQKEMGESSHHPNWAIALKPKDKVYTSEVVNIHWNCGRTGKITPRVEIKPVNIDGVTVTFATGHNARMILDMGIKQGVTIEIIRSGSVIPYIVKVIK